MITPTPPSLRDFAPALLGQAVADALQAQATLTAVDRFSSWHGEAKHAEPELEPWYRELLPLHAPSPGEQYAFEVDLDRCSGCKACVTACHNLNGLDDDEGESFRDVGLLLDPDNTRGPQHITSACHHCLQPGCADGCPVLAYEKEPDTGVVRHLDDQCIGCEYCVLKCPYDVPKYHHGKGIVRKCDLCVGRLRAGEAPACVQACPTKAIRVTVVSTVMQPAVATMAQAGEKGEKGENPSGGAGFELPGAPDPEFTRPTTRYKSTKPLPQGMLPGDARSLRPEAAHEPLAATLVITQLAFGLNFAQCLYRYALTPGHMGDTLTHAWPLTLLPFIVMQVGLLVGLGHLGRPKLAWKAWMNWRRSWLSREVIAFAAFAGIAGAVAAMATALGLAPALMSTLGDFQVLASAASTALGLAALALPFADAAALLISGIALFANAMVYIDTPRAAWRSPLTLARFALTSLGTGAIGMAAAIAMVIPTSVGSTVPADLVSKALPVLLVLGAAAHLAKLASETWILRHRYVTSRDAATPMRAGQGLTSTQYQLRRSAALLLGPKGMVFTVRIVLGLAAVTLAVGAANWLLSPDFAGQVGSTLLAQQALVVLFGLFFAADCLERHLFFSAAASPRMPGTM
jgi:formate dehydrogenase iron-sulfur subunit